ncbi:hypothetical protein FDECE_9936 [Fusarium decemcellulare]|nr:hypothetical protein FDECE_9936 [Fusarium decemcellulare]
MNPQSQTQTFSASSAEVNPLSMPLPSMASVQPVSCPHRTRCECPMCDGCTNEISNWDNCRCATCDMNCPE